MVHGGQFAVLKVGISLPSYTSVYLDSSWILSYHKKLPVTHNHTTKTVLLGHAWSIKGDGEEPSKFVAEDHSIEEILKEEPYWCGRYVLISDGKVYLDASGLFGVFYSEDGISSDLSFLAKKREYEEHEWEADNVMRWFPGPDTPYRDIKRMLPSQVYDYNEKDISFRNIFCDIKKHSSEENLIEDFSNMFISSLKNLSSHFADKQLLLALTGGYDSRTLLALAMKAEISFECYTLEHDKMPLCDIDYPKELCEIAGVEYEYYERDPDKYSVTREGEYARHLHYMQMEQDRTFYHYNQYKDLASKYDKDVVLLRSGVWEISQEYDRKTVAAKVNRNNVYDHYELKLASKEKRSLTRFFDWCDTYPMEITDTDRYFWEQRCGSWIAESEHGFDIYDNITSLQPMNCRYLISMLFEFPEEERMYKKHQEKITNTLCPSFTYVPYGKNEVYSKNKLKMGWKKVENTMRRIKKIGLPRTIRLYKNISKVR